MVGFSVIFHSFIDVKLHSCNDQGEINFAAEIKVEEMFYSF